MSSVKLKLISPDNLPIVGVKLNDGEIGKVTCHYNNENTAVQDWVFTLNVKCNDDKYSFIDSNDNEIELTTTELFELSISAKP